MSRRVLLTSDDSNLCTGLERRLDEEGFSVSRAAEASEALRLVVAEEPDAVVLDLELCDLLEELSALPRPPVVLVVAEGAGVSTAVAALRGGAQEFLLKPVSAERVLRALREALPWSGGVIRPEDPTLRRLVGRSSAMRRVLDQIGRIACSASTVLIRGETGSGKSLVARRVHAESPLSGESLTVVAGRGDGDGAFERACNTRGALLLEDVDELEPRQQEQCVRLLEALSTDVRVLATAGSDLLECVERGSFDASLFYRLNVHSIEVPALRERQEDLSELAAHFLALQEETLGRRFGGFTTRAMERLSGHSWPGNVRELESAIARAAALAPSVPGARLGPGHLGLPDLVPNEGEAVTSDDLSLRAVEEAHIRRVLADVDGNRSRAARLLGVNRTTLYSKLRRYGLHT